MNMYEYKNPSFIPRIHDFGDDYHLPDVDEDNEALPMVQVKKIRRRYQNWFDYLDACNLYDEYVTQLKNKYGGDTQFKLAMLMGQVREYIPNYPQLKKNRRNRYYYKNRIPRIEREPVEFEEAKPEEIANLPDPKVKVKLANAKKIDTLYSRSADFTSNSIAQIAGELDMLNAYWIRNSERIESMKVGKKRKKRLKRSLNRKTLKISLQYRSISDILAMDAKRRKDKFFNRLEEDSNLGYYKGSFVSMAEQDQLEITEQLKSLGVVFSKLTKSSTKLIRNKLLKKSKEGSKKKRKKRRKMAKLDAEFAMDISGDYYSNYKELEEGLAEMTGSRRFDKY